jgi:secreted trypsin-like serine protease
MKPLVRFAWPAWTAILVVWTALLFTNSGFPPGIELLRRKSQTRDIKAELARLAKARVPSRPSAPNVQALGLLMQSQDISEFINSEPPQQDLKQAVALLATTNRQAALAVSKQSLGFVWNGGTAQKGQFPYQVGVVLNNYVPYADRGFQCAGALITSMWVLTAGHCFDDDSQPSDIEVFSGHLNLSESQQANCNCWSTVAKLVRFPDYKLIDTRYGQIIEGDVALLRLDSALSAPGLGTIQIAQAVSEPNILKSGLGTVVGWGKSTANPSSLSDALLYGTVKVAPDIGCTKSFDSGIIRPDMLCGNPYPASACNGDSGGPLVMKAGAGAGSSQPEYVTGIVSWGYPLGACPPTKPTVFSRVAAFSVWINQCVSGGPCPSSIPRK